MTEDVSQTRPKGKSMKELRRVDVDGDELELFGGAGFGSGWATVSFRGKTYGLAAHELVEALLEAVAPEALREAS